MAGRLEGKTAVITGGTSGIGLATARRFVEEGAFVFITGRRKGALDSAVRALGKNAKGIQGDVSSLEDLDRLYAVVAKERGGIDVLFANAGMGEFATLPEVTEGHFDKIIGINVRGTLFTVQKALPLLSEGASIILTGSVAGSKGFGAFGVYNASKAAIRSFARSWTTELKDRRIRVNVISPGPIDTPILEPAPSDVVAHFVSQVPLGRIGKPEEIANAALFLASADSSYVAGIELFVDGGMAQI